MGVEANGGKLPFGRFHNAGTESNYSPYTFQNDLGADVGRLETFGSDVSFHEQSTLPFSSRITQDDSYQLNDCGQGISKDSGSEADLYGLVSTILDDAEPLDSDLCQEISIGLKTMWSPNSVRENSIRYPNPEVKTQFGRKPHHYQTEISDIYQDFNGFESSLSSWPLSGCNVEPDTYRPAVADVSRLPPGLDISPGGGSYFSKSGSGNDDSNDSYFSSYRDLSALSGPGIENNKQFLVRDTNRLASDIQALLWRDQQSLYNKAMMAQHCESTSGPNERGPTLAAQVQNVKGGMTGSLRQPKAGDLGNKIKPLQHHNKANDIPPFELHSADYVQPPKSFASTFNFSTPYQSSKACEREPRTPHQHQHQHGRTNSFQSQTKLPSKSSVHSDSQMRPRLVPHPAAEFVPVSASQQTHRSVQRAHADFRLGDGMMNEPGLGLDSLRNVAGHEGESDWQSDTGVASATSFTDGFSSQWYGTKPKRQTDNRQGLLQSPYQIVGNMYAGQARHANSAAGKPVPPHMFPCLFQVGASGQTPCRLFSPRSSFPYNGPVPVMDVSEPLPDVEFQAAHPYLPDVMGSSAGGGDGLLLGLLSSLRSPKVGRNRVAPTCQLHHYLEECYEQWRMLEKERKKTETVLMKSYPGKHLSTATSNAVPKMPPNPSRVDRLVVDQLREQAKVMSLLGKMERLRSFPLHANICSTLDRHMEAICVTQARRKDEFLNGTRQRQSPAHPREDREVLLLASALKDLSSSTRKSRTALWCALQMTLPKTSADDQAEREARLASGPQSPDQVVPEGVVSAL